MIDIVRRKTFDKVPTCIADMFNKYIYVNSKYFYVHRINEFGDACLQLVDDNGKTNIGNIELPSRKHFTIVFKHHGFTASAKIKYSEIKFSNS